MTLDSAFERVYLISLSYREDRRKRALRVLLDAGLISSESKVSVIDAVSGDRVGGGPAWWSAGAGAWGCLASHSQCVWRAASDKLESYCVLEDDIVAHSESARVFSEAFAEVSADRWGQFYLGGQFQGEKPVPVDGSRWLVQPNNVNRTHAFALHRRAFEPFQRHIWHAPDYQAAIAAKRKDGWHIDDQLGDAHDRRVWVTRCPRWWILGQCAGPSNISGRHLPEMWWHWARFRTRLPVVIAPKGWTEDDLDRSGMGARLHFGNKLIDGRLQDVGLKRVFAKPDDIHSRLDEFLLWIAREAIEMGRLPAIQHPSLEADMVREVWKPELVVDSPAELEPEDFAYPFKGRFAFDPRAVDIGGNGGDVGGSDG